MHDGFIVMRGLWQTSWPHIFDARRTRQNTRVPNVFSYYKPMSETLRPTYAAAFRCIGPECEDTCCGGHWNIPLDQATHDRYRQFPPQALGNLVTQFVTITQPPHPPGHYAQIEQTEEHLCPFFSPEHLCNIQATYGPQLLSATCSIYPRALNHAAGLLEGSLTLSCPEAARNLLLNQHSTQVSGDLHSGAFRTDNFLCIAPHWQQTTQLYPLRALLFEIVTNRTHPLTARILHIGTLCQTLDRIPPAQSNDLFPMSLETFRHAPYPELSTLPSRPGLKLEIILELTNERVADRTSGRRFQDTFWTFIEGIGTPIDEAPAEDPPADDLQRLLYAHQHFYRPFIEARPWILENYLINYIFQKLFPFGREGSDQIRPRTLFEEYLLLVTHVAWIETLLIGTSAHAQHAFSEADVIRVIQSLTRAVEHYPHVLTGILNTLHTRGLATLEGSATLLNP